MATCSSARTARWPDYPRPAGRFLRLSGELTAWSRQRARTECSRLSVRCPGKAYRITIDEGPVNQHVATDYERSIEVAREELAALRQGLRRRRREPAPLEPRAGRSRDGDVKTLVLKEHRTERRAILDDRSSDRRQRGRHGRGAQKLQKSAAVHPRPCRGFPVSRSARSPGGRTPARSGQRKRAESGGRGGCERCVRPGRSSAA